MGASTHRVGRVLVSNTAAANTGHTVLTIANDDVILFNRHFDEVADTDTVQTSADAAHLYVALGGPTGVIADQEGIQTRNVRSVKVTPYTAATPYSATITVGTPANNTEYILKVIYRDEFSTNAGHSAPRSYTFTTDATATAQELVTGLVAAINADNANTYVTAADAGSGTFTITGKDLPVDIVGGYERVTFDVALPVGFSAAAGAGFVYTAGTAGSGIGAKLKELERDTNNYTQRRLWPVPADQTRTVSGNKYNVVTISHDYSHLADFSRPAAEPRKVVIAFLTTDGTPSAKQAAFMTKLTSVVESAGVFVS